jgi:signal peptidase I
MSYRKPRRGEVIVFIYPKEPDKDFIKRIVAVEGDTVEVKDDTLYINGKPIERHKVDGDCSYWDFKEGENVWDQVRCDRWIETLDGHTFTTFHNRNEVPHNFPAQHVPPEHVFVMGDNRDNSHDSRYWGFVPFDYIKGKAMIIWWSAGEPSDGPGTFRGVRYGRMFHLVQ